MSHLQPMNDVQTEAPAAEGRCPNCNAHGLEPFYAVSGIPVHSCMLMRSRAEALAFPTGNLSLGFCRRCGFIANTLFDPAHEAYCARYEESQGFSGCFNRWMEGLVRRLIDRYGLRRKTVLEIGCGKGDFLVRLCELGDNQGVGIDPSCIPQRIPSQAAGRVTLIRDYYGPNYAHLTADFICCRHTLEHIAPTRQFLLTLRRSIGRRLDTVVFVEVPDVLRVLNEAAFWDIYYEHCSYFSAGSLARLFRGCGFDLMELELDYDGQYILLTARPSAVTRPSLELEDDLAALEAAVARFRSAGAAHVEGWRQRVRAMAASGKKVALWGAGSKCVAFLSTLGLTQEVACVADVNPFKQGTYTPGTGHEIVAPQRLAEIRPDAIVVMNRIYVPEIRQELERLGVKAELLAV